MSEARPDWTDVRVERVVGNLLRAGVLLAAAVVALGGVMYLAGNATELADYRSFKGEPGDLRSPGKIVVNAWHMNSLGVIQFGLLLLIATPVARVIFSVFAFACQRDRTYIVITLIVLVVLLYSLFLGHLA
ncbi:MAG TPA: DUF1634 domain-containing protein [Pirellulales bacterium]|nr:DUF1634 domain-containing protein [Pirellulales bacterium]